MPEKVFQYKHRKFKSLSKLYRYFSDVAAVSEKTFLSRVSRGISIPDAISKPKRSYKRLSYNGISYPSAQSCYMAEKKRIRSTRHRRPAIDYGTFLDIVKKSGVTSAINEMHQWHRHQHKDKGLKSRSVALGGADNLVCQRITKLGWSLEKAMSTPRSTKGFPIKVYYKGNHYPSITACFSSVLPEMSIVKFTAYLREHNFHID